MRVFVFGLLLFSAALNINCNNSDEIESDEDQPEASLESNESVEEVTESTTEQSQCNKVIPLRTGYITKFVGSRYYKANNVSMELYMREGNTTGEIEAIFKNVTEVCNPKKNCKKKCNCVHEIDKDYVENNILYIRCLENSWFDLKKNTFRYQKKSENDTNWRSMLVVLDNWVGLSYNREVIDWLRNSTDLTEPKTFNMNPSGDCQEVYKVRQSSNPDSYNVTSYTNNILCPDRIAGSNFEHKIILALDKIDYTIRSFQSQLKTTDNGVFFIEQMKFEQFLLALENETIFKERDYVADLGPMSDEDREVSEEEV